MVAPRFNDVAGFDPGGYSLTALPVAIWHGWVFVNATADAVPFVEHVGALDEIVAPYVPGQLTRRARHTYEIAANWKIIGENYHECYHCPLIHPELCEVSPPTSGDNYDRPGAWVGGVMDLQVGADTMSLSGKSSGPPIPGARTRHVEYLHLFPNLLLSLHPDYVMTHRLLPLAPDRTWIECSWYFAADDVDPGYAVDFWDLTNRQDWAACESVQRGLRSPHFKPGPLAPGEDAVHQWVTMVGRGYRGMPPHTS
jgi:Rieske 2Fe-2S family protein